MKWFYDLNIATKLISSFVVVLLLTAAMGIFSIMQLAAVNSKAAEIKNDWLPSMRAIQTARYYATSYRMREARHILADDQQQMAQIDSELTDTLKDLDVRIKTYESLLSNEEDRQQFLHFTNK